MTAAMETTTVLAAGGVHRNQRYVRWAGASIGALAVGGLMYSARPVDTPGSEMAPVQGWIKIFGSVVSHVAAPALEVALPLLGVRGGGEGGLDGLKASTRSARTTTQITRRDTIVAMMPKMAKGDRKFATTILREMMSPVVDEKFITRMAAIREDSVSDFFNLAKEQISVLSKFAMDAKAKMARKLLEETVRCNIDKRGAAKQTKCVMMTFLTEYVKNSKFQQNM